MSKLIIFVFILASFSSFANNLDDSRSNETETAENQVTVKKINDGNEIENSGNGASDYRDEAIENDESNEDREEDMADREEEEIEYKETAGDDAEIRNNDNNDTTEDDGTAKYDDSMEYNETSSNTKNDYLIIPQIGIDRISLSSVSTNKSIESSFMFGPNIGVGIDYPVSVDFNMATTLNISFFNNQYNDTIDGLDYKTSEKDIIPKLTQSISMSFESTLGVVSPFFGIHLGRLFSTINEDVSDGTTTVKENYKTKGLLLGAGVGVSIIVDSQFFGYLKYTFDRFSSFSSTNEANLNIDASINTQTLSTGIGWVF